MDKQNTARFNAFHQVLHILKDNQEKFVSTPAMNNVTVELEGLTSEISNLLVKVESIPLKTAGNKNVARFDLIATNVKVSNAVKAYAFIEKNENLLNFLVTAESHYVKRMRRHEVLDYSKNLLHHITLIFPQLSEYGLTDTMKQELESGINKYEELFTEPRQLISLRKTTNELILEKIDETNSLLANRIDPLMELFKNDQELYMSYKSARMIVDPARRKRGE